MPRYIVHNCYLALGWICLLLGGIGIFVPGLPTTIFWIISLWAFTKTSNTMSDYLLDHPRYGRILREWSDYRVVPPVGKIASGISMAIICVVSIFTMHAIWAAVMICFTLTLVFGYIVTRPSRAPNTPPSSTVIM